MKSDSDLVSRLQQHKGFQRFQEFEARQQTQEVLRQRLGAPAGKAPPVVIKQISLPELQARNEIQMCRSPVSPRLVEAKKSPRFRIDLSKVSQILPSHSVPSIDTNKRASVIVLSSARVHSPFEPGDSFQYAVPDAQDIRTFNPFLRPKARNHFFPADLFHLDPTDYTNSLFPVEGKARWWLSDGTSVWKPCRILGFSEETGFFTIEWIATGTQKLVSRFNIMFRHEKEEDFLKNLAEASQRRDLLEAVLRYETRLTASAERFPEITMPAEAENRILWLLRSVITRPEEQAKVVEELHAVHRRNIVNFVFQVEHFVTKSLLTARPWMEQLQELERKRAYIRKQMQESRRSISFSRAQRKLARYRYHPQDSIRDCLRTFLEKLSEISEVNLYYFLMRREKAATLPELEEIYKEVTATRIAAIAGLSVDASNCLCELLPESPLLPRICQL